ncbi:MAG TPA: energy transducer TonB [Methylococcaceae bacterium]|nr:energy transducer TonB [Methylococcaceae bacterium]
MNKFVFSLLGLTLSQLVFAQDEPQDLGIMNIVGTSPLGGNIDADKLPTNIQTATAAQLEKAQTLSLGDYINRYLGSAHVNDAQNNPLQPDIYYRGFVASPMMGLPQGLSTYVNGVRFNEPFGDTVNWDLIPQNAIDSMAMYSSNPVYGLNSLGGAIAIKTKTGFSAPKHQLEVYGGSFDRHSEDLTSGWNNGTWGYFIDLNHFEEAGWRDFSPTKATRGLGTLSWRGDRGSLDLTLGANDNNMYGNAATPIQLLNENRKAIFTHPDITTNRMFFSELAGSYDVSDDIEVSGNAYFRQNRMHTFNGDNSDYTACEDNAFLCDAGEPVIDTHGNPIVFSDSVDGATRNTNAMQMRSKGGTLQTAFTRNLFKHENNLTVGTSFDVSQVHFASDTEMGAITADRGTVGSGVYDDESKVRLHAGTEAIGVFLTDTFSITEKLAATVAGRYNRVVVDMQDQYMNDEEGKNLNGHHTFERLNPSAGLTYQLLNHVNVYGNYAESSRAPTPMELSCADPQAPCKLPNSFMSDPALNQVVSKTWEGGLRGDLNHLIDGQWRWNVGFFHAINNDDIIFHRSGSLTSQGYFSNVGKTRRYGIESGTSIDKDSLFSAIDDWHFSTNYTYLNARYLDGFDIQNPLEEGELLRVDRGDKIASIPEHLFKAALSVDLWKKVSLGINGQYSGQQFFRGDEANATQPLSGYWLFNGTAEYKITKNLALFGKVNNIFDVHYNTFGVYGQAADVLGEKYDDGRFISPGAPRAGWIGVRLSL